ncbi:MAG: nucleoside hydrolase [Oscillospiraceae bacterium]|nr:nucleoside hydrolase [Oscillospiraceae bacterium]
MRKFIIDTDTGSDDAAAILITLAEPDIEILGLTTVSGNVPLAQATLNALQTLEVVGSSLPVYKGAAAPLFRPLVTADSIHGRDGLGDCGLVHPVRGPEESHGADFILEMAKKYPGELELITLGPVTNIALALMKDRETMKGIKHIWSMGTAGFGVGNCTPVAEFNVYVDAESYAYLLESGIPMTIVGFDLCLGKTAFWKEDLEELRESGAAGKFVTDCTNVLLSYNLRERGEHNVDMPDAVAMGVALWPDIVEDSLDAYCYCCTKEEPAYGQVIIYDPSMPLSVGTPIPPANAKVIRRIDTEKFKANFKQAIRRANCLIGREK